MDVDEMDLELDLSTQELAGIYTAKGWQLADTSTPYPLPEDLAALASNLVGVVTGDKDCGYATLGRLVAFTDTEFPGSVELALVIGRATPALGDDADLPGVDGLA